MRNLVRISVALVLYAVPVVSAYFPSTFNWIYKGLLIPLSLALFLVHEIILIWSPTVPKEEVTEKFQFFRLLLETITKDKMLAAINQQNANNPINRDDFRVNIMLPVRRGFFLLRQRMRIFYYSDAYTDDEQETYWYKGKKGSGTCGTAWNLGKPVMFDTQNRNFRRPQKRLNDQQKAVERLLQVNSIISFPICARGKKRIIGVLNFDSNLNLNRTFFSQSDIINTGLEAAAFIAYVLPDRKVAL